MGGGGYTCIWEMNLYTKLYPTFEWTRERDLVLNAANVDYTRQVMYIVKPSQAIRR